MNSRTGYLLKQELLQLLEAALATGCYGLSGPVDDMEVGKCLHWLGMEFMDIRDLCGWKILHPFPLSQEKDPYCNNLYQVFKVSRQAWDRLPLAGPGALTRCPTDTIQVICPRQSDYEAEGLVSKSDLTPKFLLLTKTIFSFLQAAPLPVLFSTPYPKSPTLGSFWKSVTSVP